MMVACRRPLTLILCLFFLFFVFFFGYSHGSRSTNVLNFKTKTQEEGHFLNFLPRHLPIPTSGPSRRHNDIGLQSSRSP
ncbi:IDA2 protein [Salix suchowensis]|nr:IDA2 protein [Salix suchowensis]